MPFVYVVAVVGALGGMLFGYDTGAISGAILYLKHQFSLSSGLQEVVTSIALAGATVGAAVGGPMADRYGRRRTIIVNAAMFIIGSIATALAQTVGWLIGDGCSSVPPSASPRSWHHSTFRKLRRRQSAGRWCRSIRWR